MIQIHNFPWEGRYKITMLSDLNSITNKECILWIKDTEVKRSRFLNYDDIKSNEIATQYLFVLYLIRGSSPSSIYKRRNASADQMWYEQHNFPFCCFSDHMFTNYVDSTHISRSFTTIFELISSFFLLI